MRFLQFPRALIATHLDRLAADPDGDGIAIQFAVTSRARSVRHDIASMNTRVRERE